MSLFGFGKKEEVQVRLKSDFHLCLTNDKKEFIVEQSQKECTSQNSIIRKAINQYRNGTIPEQE